FSVTRVLWSTRWGEGRAAPSHGGALASRICCYSRVGGVPLVFTWSLARRRYGARTGAAGGRGVAWPGRPDGAGRPISTTGHGRVLGRRGRTAGAGAGWPARLAACPLA